MTQGEPLPDGDTVLRMAIPPGIGQSLEIAFVPSSADEASALSSLSVFAERFTMPEQAQAFVSPRHTLALRLPVGAVRSLRPTPDLPEVASLNVVWDLLRDARPGAAGHAGITGLVRPQNIPRSAYRSYRSQLADLAKATGIIAIG